MYNIRKLSTEKDFKDFGEIGANAYPGQKIVTLEEKEKLVENIIKTHNDNPYVKFYGAFNNEEMVGGMRLHDFKMNLLSTKITAGGIGFVAVDLLHKKERVAKEIVTYFINHYKKLGATMALLYPFRPDFYKKMGFGFGTSMNQYKVKPCNLPKGTSKANVKFIKEEEASLLLDCYTRIYEKTNGLIEKYEQEFKTILKTPKFKVVGYKNKYKVEGFLVFEFRPVESGNILINDIYINDLIFENTTALSELMTFLNSQNDQIRHIIFNLQDEDFRFLLDDPRNDSNNLFAPVYHECSIQGTGIMYRVINTKALFKDLKDHNFNNVSCKLKLTIKDSFVEDNHGSIIIAFTNGLPAIVETEVYDVEINLDMADFSSLITCAVSFRSLYKYGKATISNTQYLDVINNLFTSGDRPICLTRF